MATHLFFSKKKGTQTLHRKSGKTCCELMTLKYISLRIKKEKMAHQQQQHLFKRIKRRLSDS